MSSFASSSSGGKSSLQERKIREAEGLLKEAKKCLTTGMFQWKKDYLSAGPLYVKAANHFRVAKEPERAIKALIDGAKCSQECGQLHEVGNAYMQAAMIAKGMGGNEQRAVDFYKKAFDVYSANDDALTATNAGKQGAVMLAKIDQSAAIGMYRSLLDMLEAQHKHTYAFEIYRDVIRLCVRAKDFTAGCELVKNAVEAFKEGNQTTTVYQWHLCEVILMIQRGDLVGAEEVFLDSLGTQGYGLSDQAAAAEELLKGVKNNDADLLEKVKKMPGLRFVPVPDIGSLAMKICNKVISAGGGSGAKKKNAPTLPSTATRREDLKEAVDSIGSAISGMASPGTDGSVPVTSRDAALSTASDSLEASIKDTNGLLADLEDDFDDLA
jgi:tetratricopeptide (TPR) repeat protein